MYKFVLVAVLSWLAAIGPAGAQSAIHPLEDIHASVERFLQQETAGHDIAPHLDVGPLDSRLRLSACDGALVHFFPTHGRKTGRVSVGVRCAGPKPWTVYVPANVRTLREVVVLARPLPRNTRLLETDLRTEMRDVSTLYSGYLTRPEEAVGMHLTRSLNAGYALNNKVVALPTLVRRGERVTLLAEAAGVQVRSAGSALANGREGEIVAVRNTSSKRVVEGTVVGAGIIKVRR